MNILITGASGFVGNALYELLSDIYNLKLVVRNKSFLKKNAEYFLVNEINGQTNWQEGLKNVDIVIHLAARVHVTNETAVNPLAEFRKINVEGTLNLARQAVDAGVKRFIFISSIGVNGATTMRPFNELSEPSPHNAYALSKFEAEQGLKKIAEQTKLEVVIIRPPLVYGAGAKANFASLLKVLNSGLPLPFGAVNNLRSFIYIDNLIDFIMLCVKHPLAANQTFVVADGQDVSTTQLLKFCYTGLGVKPRLIPIPAKVLSKLATLLGKASLANKLLDNLQIDISKAKNLLGWVPPVTVEEGLKLTAASYLTKNK